MRRAFTLIELLVIIAIIGIMVTASVLSVQAGREAVKIRGAARDIFAAVRQARSIALVSQKPCIITFSTKTSGDEVSSSVVITSAELVKKNATTSARSIGGEWKRIGEAAEEEEKDESRQAFHVRGRDDDKEQKADSSEGGHTVEEVLFQNVAQDVLEGICIKVVMDDEEVEPDSPRDVNEAKKSMISTFSNVDFLLGTYRDERKKEQEAAAAEAAKEDDSRAANDSKSAQPEAEEKSLAWQVNGRCDPHTIYIYAPGEDWRETDWRIRVDRFGAVKVLSNGEDE